MVDEFSNGIFTKDASFVFLLFDIMSIKLDDEKLFIN